MEPPVVVLDRITAELTDAASIPIGCWSRPEIADWLVGLHALRSRLDALLSDAAIAAERAAVPSLDGARTVRTFVAGRTRTTGADAGLDLALGRWLDMFPSVADAHRAGRIGRRHVQALRDLDNPRTHRLLLDAQDYLAEAAATTTWHDFETVCVVWLHNADPDGDIPRHHRAQRRVSVRTHADGTVTGSFRLDAIDGAAIRNALDTEALRLWNHDAATGTHRSHAQRLADAFIDLVTRGAARPNGRAPAPLVHVVVGESVLADAIVRTAADAADVPAIGADGELLPDGLGIDPTDPLRRCELVDGTPIHPNQAVGLLGSAILRRLVLGANHEILNLGTAVRTFPRHLKDALLAAQRGRCGVPHCHTPLAWLQADHVHPAAHGGPTATHNGQITCGADNRAKGTRHGPHHDHRRHPPPLTP